MLPAIRENLDGLSEQETQHYIAKDGKFILDVGPVEGLSLENVAGLKTTVETLRGIETKLTKELAALNTKFTGIDPEQARLAVAKYDEVKNFDKDGKVKEAIEAHKRDLVANHTAAVAELEKQLKAAQDQLDDALVTSKVVEALQSEKGNVELLKPHVMSSIVVKTGADNKRYPEVVGTNGEPRVGDSAGNPMTILQRVQEMKTQKSFAAAFEGVNSSGGGGGGSEDGISVGAGGGKVIKALGGQVITGDLDSIASGETKVVVSQT